MKRSSKPISVPILLILFLIGPTITFAGLEGTASKSMIQPEKTLAAKDGNWLGSRRAFGDQEPAAKMKKLMMEKGKYVVEVKAAKVPVRVGSNLINITVKDGSTKQLMKGLNLKVKVYMIEMDMGTEEPAVSEISRGQYQLKASFTMRGQWAVKLELPGDSEQVTTFDVIPSK